MDSVIAALEAASATPAEFANDWSTASLQSLSAHIVATHHSYVKRELPRLDDLAAKVVARHGDTRSELTAIQSALSLLNQELTQHLAKEEAVLFPYIVQLEAALASNGPRPQSCFGTVANPIAMMTAEHDAAGELLAEISKLSSRFTTPITRSTMA
jgi:regulator of cell morphogenesis and NO signaling